MFQKVVELVRENDELREEVDITSNTFWMFFPFHFPGLNLSLSYFQGGEEESRGGGPLEGEVRGLESKVISFINCPEIR